MSKLLTFAVIVTLIGCESKEYKKSENSNVEIVSELNQGDSESVIQKLSNKEDLSARQRYYLASALSQKGGVDVFSLYSVLELQLFRKNALEWSDLSKEKNPYLKFMKNQDGIDPEKRQKKRVAKWEKYEEKIRGQLNIEPKPTIESINHFYNDDAITAEEYDSADKLFQTLSDEYAKKGTDSFETSSQWFEDKEAIFEKHKLKDQLFNLFVFYGEELRFKVQKEKFLNPDKSNSNMFGNVAWEVIYLNVLWNTYETIPVMKKMPNLTDDNQVAITEALDQYQHLVNDPEFKDVTFKNIAILAGVSVLSIYKQSFDMDEISSIEDLMCSFDPEPIVNNYDIIRKRLVYLSETFSKVESTGNLKQYETQVENIKNSLPEHLTEEQKDRFRLSIDNFKVKSCFKG